MDTVTRSVDIMLEFYRQAVTNARLYVELRFKHFTTFMVITGLLGATTFRVPEVAAYRSQLAVLGVVVSTLFWLLDYRTYQLFRAESTRATALERALNDGMELVLPPRPREWVRASFVTNVLFALILLMWTAVWALW